MRNLQPVGFVVLLELELQLALEWLDHQKVPFIQSELCWCHCMVRIGDAAFLLLWELVKFYYLGDVGH